jgi:hypothetical protein
MKTKKATPKVMKLIDPYTGLMECRVCGYQHTAMVKPLSNGNFYRGTWQCINGCELKKDAEIEKKLKGAVEGLYQKALDERDRQIKAKRAK